MARVSSQCSVYLLLHYEMVASKGVIQPAVASRVAALVTTVF